MVNTVTFPGLGLSFELDRVAFTILGKDIYWYGVIIAVGFVLAVWYGCSRAKGFGVDQDKLYDLLFLAVPMAIIGARAYYVIFYPELYHDAAGKFDWGAAVAVWDGGLAIYGGVIAAFSTGAIYCAVRKQPFWSYADCGAFGFLIGQCIGRWGNFMNVEAYGGVTALPWRMCSPSIANELLYAGQIGQEAYEEILNGTLGVHPTFFYESLWNLLGFVLLVLIARKGRKFNGQFFLSYVIWYGLGRTIIEGLRTDSLYFFGTGIRTSQMVAVLSAVAALVVYVIRLKTAGPASGPFVKETDLTKEEKEDGGDQD
ncbi:MAG: prolipoprotein diacylglyceryl transferase [Oscillospiraceae bacterium]|nr:prolipoprotein diacylglyceryl transferase [Oscillospiraceae bacterium]